MDKVRRYAAEIGVQPSTVVQRAAQLSGAVWSRWEADDSSPTLKTADKILRYISDNPPQAKGEDVK